MYEPGDVQKTEAGNIRSYASGWGELMRESMSQDEEGLGPSLGGRVRVGQPFEIDLGSRKGDWGDIGQSKQINGGPQRQSFWYFLLREICPLYFNFGLYYWYFDLKCLLSSIFIFTNKHFQSVMRWTVYVQSSCVEVIIPSTSEYNCIWRCDLVRDT